MILAQIVELQGRLVVEIHILSPVDWDGPTNLNKRPDVFSSDDKLFRFHKIGHIPFLVDATAKVAGARAPNGSA